MRRVAGWRLAVLMVVFSAAAAANNLPVPPLPPEHPIMTKIAPMPNPDAQAPVAPASGQPSVNVRLYRAESHDPSMGFTPGSHYQTSEDRKPIQTPGLSFSVPIQ